MVLEGGGGAAPLLGGAGGTFLVGAGGAGPLFDEGTGGGGPRPEESATVKDMLLNNC